MMCDDNNKKKSLWINYFLLHSVRLSFTDLFPLVQLNVAFKYLFSSVFSFTHFLPLLYHIIKYLFLRYFISFICFGSVFLMFSFYLLFLILFLLSVTFFLFAFRNFLTSFCHLIIFGFYINSYFLYPKRWG